MREVMGEDGNRAYCDTLEEFIDYAKCDVELICYTLYYQSLQRGESGAYFYLAHPDPTSFYDTHRYATLEDFLVTQPDEPWR